MRGIREEEDEGTGVGERGIVWRCSWDREVEQGAVDLRDRDAAVGGGKAGVGRGGRDGFNEVRFKVGRCIKE